MDTSISSNTLNYILIYHLLKNSLLFAILTEKRHYLIIASIKDNFIKMRGGIGLLKHQQKKPTHQSVGLEKIGSLSIRIRLLIEK